MTIEMKYFFAGCSVLFSLLQTAIAHTDSTAYENKYSSIVSYDVKNISINTNLEKGQSIPLYTLFLGNQKIASVSDAHEVRILNTLSDHNGTSHHRARQYYKGIEIDKVQLLLHEKEGKVYLAHGNLIKGIKLETNPMITETQAFKIALMHLEPGTLLWQDPNSKYNKANSTKLARKGKLLITSGNAPLTPENLALVYRFDIVTIQPLGRFYVDINAQTGELFNKSNQLCTGDVISYGQSLYHDSVPIIVSDEDYPQWRDSARWHTDPWRSLGNTGLSWWISDPEIGTYGGYGDRWYEVLETPPIILTGTVQELSFYHRYSVEEPETYEEYDGWDGMNVRISTDSGKSWQILNNPSVPYTCSSLFSFGYEHNEGPDIPGWGGKLDLWTRVVFDISDYKDDTVIIRFAFASDPAFSAFDGNEELFGWQIDNINVSNSTGSLFYDDGMSTQMIPKNIAQDVRFVEGSYRLREIGRGSGISTYNVSGADSYSAAVDFVSDDSVFSQVANKAGVSAHWAQEATYDYYLNHFGRKSYDDEDGRLIAYVNWDLDEDINNAVWVGFASVYGAGDNQSFGAFADLDVVGHEITHGVTEYSAGLLYENEPGALNESFSDIFGESIEIGKLGLQDNSWSIGDNISLKGSCLRSMKDPNTCTDPDTYKGTFWKSPVTEPASDNDWGGVHTNSGVQNYWFYLLCEGGSGTNDHNNDYSVSGIGIEDASDVAYRNLTVYLQPTSGYWEAATYSVQAAIDLFGENSSQHQSVIDAWFAVGIYFTPKIHAPKKIQFITDPGESIQRSVTIQNIGMQDLTVTDVQLEGGRFQLKSIPGLPVTIAPNGTLDLTATFYAVSGKEENGIISIYSDDPYLSVKEIALVGNPVNPTPLESISDNRSSFQLYQNFPNPFSSETSIRYNLTAESTVMLKIFNLSGEEIRTLVQQKQTGGLYSVSWDGCNDSGNRVSAGVYIYTIQTEEYYSSKRLIVH